MNSPAGLMYGFAVAFTPHNLLACFSGVLLGTIIGVLPGIGPVGAMALLIPATFAFEPATAIIMMAGIFYGAMFGGSTTSILINVPGEAASVVTTIDGYQMARKGRAGAALAVSAVGSFVAGTMGLVGLQLFAPPLANAALSFGPPEFCVLALLGLVVLSSLGGGSPLKSYLMAALGLLLSTIGMEGMSGYSRYTFGRTELMQGVEIIPVAMGLFGIAEVLVLAEEEPGALKVIKVKLRDLLPTRAEWARSFPAVFRGGGLGFLVGLLPGPSAVISTFASYALEKRTAIAMLLGALMIHGVQPGPLLMQQRPDIFWGVVASMYIGNLMLLILNLPLVGMFTALLRIPRHILTTLIVILCVVGTFGVNNSMLDIYVLVAMGGLGYILRKLRFDLAPIILGLILGSIIETRFNQSMIFAQGNPWVLLQRPITAGLLIAGALAILLPVVIRRTGKHRSAV